MSITPPPPQTAASRRSYFREAPMEEYTPANSIRDAPLHEREERFLSCLPPHGQAKLVLRVLNAVTHTALCSVLLAIMIEFMVRYQGQKRRPEAIALITIVAVDCCLDLYAVIRLKKKWQGWALCLRLLLSLAYLAQFFIYVGFQKLFPHSFAYWGMTAGYSDPVVYMVLWLIGIWNLLHTAIHRHTVGRDLCKYAGLLQIWRRRTNPGDESDIDSSVVSGPSRSFERHMDPLDRIERGPDSEVTISLNDMPTDGDKRLEMVMSAREATPSESGESSRTGTTACPESKTTIDRTSTAVSEETIVSESKP